MRVSNRTKKYIVMKKQRDKWHLLLLREDMNYIHAFVLFSIAIFQYLNGISMVMYLQEPEPLQKRLESVYIGYTIISATAISIEWTFNHRKLYKYINKLQDICDKYIENPKLLNIIVNEAKSVDLPLQWFAGLLCTNAILFSFVPFVKYVTSKILHPSDDIRIARQVELVYPWDTNEISPIHNAINFICRFLSSMVTCVVLSFNVATPTNLFVYLTAFTKVTQEKFKLIDFTKEEDEVKRLLKEAIDCHKLIYEILEEVNTLSSIEMFSLVVSIYLGISMSLFLAVKSDTLFAFVKYSSLAANMLLTASYFCAFGQKFENQLNILKEEIYNMKWYECNSNHIKRDLLFCLLRANRINKISAFNYIDINLRTLNDILTRSYSLFTFLLTMTT